MRKDYFLLLLSVVVRTDNYCMISCKGLRAVESIHQNTKHTKIALNSVCNLNLEEVYDYTDKSLRKNTNLVTDSFLQHMAIRGIVHFFSKRKSILIHLMQSHFG